MLTKEQKMLIGEKIKVESEKEIGVVTRIDAERGIIYVLFKRMREEAYPYPESLDQGLLTPVDKKKWNHFFIFVVDLALFSQILN